MAYSTAYRTAIKQEPESSHHTRYLPIQETQDQQDVVTASLNHRASIEPGYVSRKPEPETSHPTSYLPKRKTQNQQDGVTTNFNPRPSIGPRYIPRKQDETTEIVVGIALGASSVKTLLKHIKNVIFANKIDFLKSLGPSIMGANPFA